MWRLLVVLALCGASLVQGEQQWASCNNVTTVQNVSLTGGTWTVHKLLQNDAFSSLSTICVLNAITVSSDSALIMMLESRYRREDGGENVEEEHLTYTTIGENKGRWSLVNARGYDMLLVSSDPSNYLALVLCASAQQTKLVGNVVIRVFVLTRRLESGNLSEENLAKITDDTVKTLGLESYSQGKLYQP